MNSIVDLTPEENFIIQALKTAGGTMNYKKLQDQCANEFEGVRLILKKLKEKKLVDYEGGAVPGFTTQIKLAS